MKIVRKYSAKTYEIPGNKLLCAIPRSHDSRFQKDMNQSKHSYKFCDSNENYICYEVK